MKKPINNRTKPTSKKKSQLDPLSESNESNLIIDVADEFVLFPLDVQETYPITQNTTNSLDDDFILFPLDVKKTFTNTNNQASITNQKSNKTKRQFVTKPNPQTIKGNLYPSPSPIRVNRPRNNKLRNIFWLALICLSFYTYNKKESKNYTIFISKTIQKLSAITNKQKSNFIDENDFKKFKKSKKIVYLPDLEYNKSKKNKIKGDSIIIIGTTSRLKNQYYININAEYGYFDENIMYEVYKYSDQKIYIDLSDGRYEDWPYNSWYDVKCENYTRETIYIPKHSISKEPLIELKYIKDNLNNYKSNLTDSIFVLKSDFERIKNFVKI